MKRIIDDVAGIVMDAGKLMTSGPVAAEMKCGVENIVTDSDIAVQDYLCRELSRLIPGCGFICEEECLCVPDREYVWIIDPIDGTMNYSRGGSDCAISVALRHGREMVAGVVYSPGRGELYSASRGEGAFRNGKLIRVSDKSFREALFICGLSVYHKEKSKACSDILLEAYMQCNDMRHYGSAAVQLCLVAAGECDIYFESQLQYWDYAAGMVILEEAGGTLCNLSGLIPSGPDLVVAANCVDCRDRFLSIVRRHI